MRFARGFVLIGILWAMASALAFAQQRVDSRQVHERILCIVPMVGSGSYDDPRRPAFAPSPSNSNEAKDSEGILGYSYQISDDGQSALVEFVARNRAAFKEILEASKSQGFKVFEKGKQRRSDILSEFRKYKKDFNLEMPGVNPL
jgi:hypothetical protein